MIVKKQWAREYPAVKDWHWTYTGWFLFGLIPLYVVRNGCFHKKFSL